VALMLGAIKKPLKGTQFSNKPTLFHKYSLTSTGCFVLATCNSSPICQDLFGFIEHLFNKM
jgi:hypothetical protein